MVEIFDNKVSISNPGGLPKSLPIEKFGSRSILRNPIIASLLHRAGHIEKMGTGIGRIKDTLKNAENPEPLFEYDSFFTVTFYRNFESSKEQGSEKSSPTGSEKSSEKSSEKIIEIIKNNPSISAKMISEKLGLSSRAVEKQISKLKSDKRIERVGPAKGGYWEVID